MNYLLISVAISLQITVFTLACAGHSRDSPAHHVVTRRSGTEPSAARTPLARIEIYAHLPCEEPSNPSCQPTPAAPPAELSFVTLHIHYPFSAASYELGSVVPRVIAEGAGIEQFGLYRQLVDGQDSGRHCTPFTLSSLDSTHLRVTVPLAVRLTGPANGCEGARPGSPMLFSLKLSASLSFDHKHWSPKLSGLSPTIEVTEGRCTALAVDITQMLLSLGNQTLAKSASDVESQLNGISLQAQAQAFWNFTTQPIHVDQTNDTWLMIRPIAWSLMPMQLSSDGLLVTATLAGRPTLQHDAILPTVLPTAMPSLDVAPAGKGVSLYHALTVPLATLSNVGAGSEFEASGRHLTLSRTTLLNSGDNIAIHAELDDKSTHIEVNFIAKPVIADRDPFELSRRGTFLYLSQLAVMTDDDGRLMDFLGNDTLHALEARLAASSIVDLGPQMESAKSTLAHELATISPIGNISLTGTIEDVTAVRIDIDTGALVVWLRLRGDLTADLFESQKGRRVCAGWPGDRPGDGTF